MQKQLMGRCWKFVWKENLLTTVNCSWGPSYHFSHITGLCYTCSPYVGYWLGSSSWKLKSLEMHAFLKLNRSICRLSLHVVPLQLMIITHQNVDYGYKQNAKFCELLWKLHTRHLNGYGKSTISIWARNFGGIKLKLGINNYFNLVTELQVKL